MGISRYLPHVVSRRPGIYIPSRWYDLWQRVYSPTNENASGESGLLPRGTARKILISYYLCGRRMYTYVLLAYFALWRRARRCWRIERSNTQGKVRCNESPRIRCVYLLLDLTLTSFRIVLNTTCCEVCITLMYIRASSYRKSGRAGAIERIVVGGTHRNVKDR